MKQYKIISLILALALLGGLFTGCSGGSAESDNNPNQATTTPGADTNDQEVEPEQVTIRLADMSVYGIAVFNYAKEIGLLDGYYDDIPGYEVTVELSDWSSGPDQNTAFAAGEIDFSIMGNIPAVTGASNGYGTKILAVNWLYDDEYLLVVRTGAGIETVADLAGKNVGTYIGTVTHYAIAKYLENAGLSLDDVSLLNVSSETATSLRTGDIDAGVLGILDANQLQEEGIAEILADSKVTIYNYVVGNEEFAEKYPDLTVRTLQLINDTWDYALEHQQEYIEFFAGVSGIDISLLELSWKDNFPVKYAKNFDETDYQAYVDFVDWMKQAEYASADLSADDLLDLTYVQQLGE